jgi:predicted MFS family arabinose efflux permease
MTVRPSAGPPVRRLASRSRLGVIFLTVFIDLVGFGLIIPILPYFAQRLGVAGLGFGALIGAFSLMQFVATVALGRLSDRFGRRPILLAAIAIGTAGYLTFAAAHAYWLLLLARMVSGFAAGNLSVAQAYIADVTSPAERSRGMGLVGAAFGLGFIVGPALGGFAGHHGGPVAVGLVAASLCVANLISAYFLLPESLHADHRKVRRLLDAEHLVRGLSDPALRPAFLVFAILPLSFSGYMVAIPLYTERVFGWGERELGAMFTLVGFVAAVVQGYLFGKISRHVSDHHLAVAGTIGMAVPIAVMPFTQHAGVVYAWVFVLAFGNSLAAPALTGLISTLAGPTEQGAMLGAAQSLSALGRFTGPFVFGGLYDWWGPAPAFLASAAVMGLGALVATRLPSKAEAIAIAGAAGTMQAANGAHDEQ